MRKSGRGSGAENKRKREQDRNEGGQIEGQSNRKKEGRGAGHWGRMRKRGTVSRTVVERQRGRQGQREKEIMTRGREKDEGREGWRKRGVGSGTEDYKDKSNMREKD